MKFIFFKAALMGGILILFGHLARAQVTETFETQTPNVNSFTSNGQAFSLTNAFAIYSSRNGIGYDGSRRFIDNISSGALNQLNSLKSTDAALFTVQNFWIFASADGGNNPSREGSLIITGKINGVVVFTLTKTLGFNGSFGSNGGFTYVNFSNEGGGDNSNVSVNEIMFELQGKFNYLAIDNFTWTRGLVLPVSVVDFSGFLKAGKVLFDWETSCESNSSHFIVERSSDGFHFQPLSTLKGAGNCNTLTRYSTADENPLPGLNYYRLIAVDFEGKRKQHGTVFIRNNAQQAAATIYPNPVTGNSLTLQIHKEATGKLYSIVDMSGKLVQQGIITGSGGNINVSKLNKGVYSLRLSDGQIVQWVKD